MSILNENLWGTSLWGGTADSAVITPTVSQCFDGVRSHLNDTEVPGGQTWTDAFLLANPIFLQTAYDIIYNTLIEANNPRVRRRLVYTLAAFTGYLSPAVAGITNFGELLKLEERDVDVVATVDDASEGSGYVSVTSVGHPFSSGDVVEAWGIAGFTEDINDSWGVTVDSADVLRLNGCVAKGAYESGGTLTRGSGDFREIFPTTYPFPYSSSAQPSLGKFAWTGDAFRFPLASVARQLAITYQLGAVAPISITASLGIDGSLGFFSAMVAALAGQAKGASPAKVEALRRIAVGEGVDSDNGPGGLLGQLLKQGVKSMQINEPPILSPPFRARRRRLIRGW